MGTDVRHDPAVGRGSRQQSKPIANQEHRLRALRQGGRILAPVVSAATWGAEKSHGTRLPDPATNWLIALLEFACGDSRVSDRIDQKTMLEGPLA